MGQGSTVTKGEAAIRRATPDDAAALHDLMRAAFGPYAEQYTPACFDATIIDAHRFAHRMREGPVWAAQADGRIVGTIGAKVDERGLYVRGMAVHPDAQRQGLGRQLLDACAEHGRALGLRAMWLSTTLFLDASADLYLAYGMQPSAGPTDLCGTPLRSFEMAL